MFWNNERVRWFLEVPNAHRIRVSFQAAFNQDRGTGATISNED